MPMPPLATVPSGQRGGNDSMRICSRLSPRTPASVISSDGLRCTREPGLARRNLEDPAGAPEPSRETMAVVHAQPRAQQRVAGIEEAHRLVTQHHEPIGCEPPSPVARMEEPSLRQDV